MTSAQGNVTDVENMALSITPAQHATDGAPSMTPMEEGQPGSSDLSRTSSSTEIDDMDPENDAGGIWHEVRTRKRTRLANSPSASSSDTIIRPKPVKEGLTVIFAPGKAETVLTDLSSLKVSNALDKEFPKCVREVRFNHRLNLIAVDALNEEAAKKLQSMTTLCSIPVLSYSPLAGPTVVGLIHSVDKELSIEDITSNLRADAEIGSVRRLGNTSSVKVTFRGNRLPSYVLLGHVRHPVSPFKARPIQCFNCFGFGHKQVACKRPKTCRHCAQHHDQTDSTCLSLSAKCVNCGQNHEATARSCPKGREVETIQTYSKANSVDFHAAKSALEHEELFPALEFTPADSSVTKELAAASGFKDIAGNKNEHSKKPTALATPYASVLKATKPKAPKSQGVRQGSTSQGIQMSAVSETPPPETTQSDLQLSTVRQRRQVREADAKPSSSGDSAGWIPLVKAAVNIALTLLRSLKTSWATTLTTMIQALLPLFEGC